MVVVVIDTETTGFGHMGKPPRPDGIIQLGIAWRSPSGKLRQWESICNPGRWYLDNADPKALEINGLEYEELTQAPHITFVGLMLADMLAAINATEIRSYNMAFDRPFLEKAPIDLLGIPWGPCIMLAATPPGERWPKLKVAAERAGVNLEGRKLHGAGTDAAIAYEVMEWLDRRNQTPQ